MSAIIFGTKPNQILPQPDFSAAKSANGGWTGSQSYLMKRGDMDNAAIRSLFPAKKRATDLDPNLESFFKFLKLSSIDNISNLPGGFTSIRVNFAGFQSAAGDFGTEDAEELEIPTYSRRGITKSAPLNEHPKWKALDDPTKETLGRMLAGELIYLTSNGDGLGDGLYFSGENGGRAPSDIQIYSTSGDSYEFAKRITQGRNTYEVGSFTWTKRWQSTKDMTAAQLNSLSRITDPPGNPTTPTGGRDWMLVSADTEQTGDSNTLYTHEITFLLSERGGHDEFLQGP